MNIIEYQVEASRTCPSLGSEDLDILHMDLGIAAEVGELLDIFKKHIAYKKELDKVHIGEEIADICWYTVNKARILEISLTKDITDKYFYKYISGNKPMLYDISEILLNYKLIGEINNLISMLFGITQYFELDFYKILDNNINKLRVRYPEKFTEENALNRNLKKERKELEK